MHCGRVEIEFFKKKSKSTRKGKKFRRKKILIKNKKKVILSHDKKMIFTL